MPPPPQSFGDDTQINTRPIYCYAITQMDVADVAPIFLCAHDGEIQIAGMPARYEADEPQVFTPGNISHGPIRRESNFDKSTFEIRALTRDITGLARYAMTGALPRVKVDVIKVNPGPVIATEPAIWGDDTLLTQTGLMSSFSFQGFSVQIECVPEPLFSGHEIPRWRFSRTCNRQLYGVDCGVVKTDFIHAGAIIDLSPTQRTVTIAGTHPDETTNYFRGGVMVHDQTGIRFSIFSSYTDLDGNLVLKLQQWNPDFQTTDTVEAKAGCRHTIEDCRDKFDNGANFGGFSEVPNKNPTIHGI
jgi:hypothetical protein